MPEANESFAPLIKVEYSKLQNHRQLSFVTNTLLFRTFGL